MYKKITLLFILISTVCISAIAQPTAFTTCPNANVGVLRAGNSGATTNPISIYNINTITGAPTLLSGPILDPASATTNLQVDGIGLNVVDGFLYGLFSDAPALSFTPTTAFYRIGANATAVQLGTLSGPTPTGGDNGSFAIPVGGEFNQSGTYHFTAVSGFVILNLFNLPASEFAPSTFYIGSLTGANALTGGTTPLAPTYVAITNPSNDAAAYLAYATDTIGATSASSLGLQDLMFNTADGQLYTYVTWPNGSSGYFGQMLRVNPSTGVLTALAPPATQSFITGTVFPNGILLDNAGNFLVLLTNGAIYKAIGSPAAYTGTLTLLNGATTLPNPLTGDFAACGLTAVPLSHNQIDFSVTKEKMTAEVKWTVADEKNIESYEIEFWTDKSEPQIIAEINKLGHDQYFFTHENGLQQGVNFYRIKINHLDGKHDYSNVRSVRLENDNNIVYPNPTRDQVNIILAESVVGTDIRLMLVNHLGQNILDKRIINANNEFSINLKSLPMSSGVYNLSIIDADGVSISQHRLQYQR